MLFQNYGVRLERPRRGSPRQRGSPHVAVVRVEALEDRLLMSADLAGGPDPSSSALDKISTIGPMSGEAPTSSGYPAPPLSVRETYAPRSAFATARVVGPDDVVISGFLNPTGAASVYKVPLDPTWSSISVDFSWTDPNAHDRGTLAILDSSGNALGQVSVSSRPAVLTVPLRSIQAGEGASLYVAVLPPSGGGDAAKEPSGYALRVTHETASAPYFAAGPGGPAHSGAAPHLPAVSAPQRSGTGVLIDPGRDGSAKIGSGLISAPFSVPLPSPMPPGVPAGGIFKQLAQGPGKELPLDSVAADLSPLGPVPVAYPAVAAFERGSLLHPAAGPAATLPGLGVIQPALDAFPDAARGDALIEAVGRPERAELPDVAALRTVAQVPRPGRSTGRTSDLPGHTLAWVMAGRGPTPVTVTFDEGAPAMTHQYERWVVVVGLAIYGAASLGFGASAPGLTSLRVRPVAVSGATRGPRGMPARRPG